MLTFKELSQANAERLFNTPKYKTCLGWSPAEWGNAIAGEVGELCNLLKKFIRGDGVEKAAIGKEIADVIIYADLIALKLGINLGQAVTHKFNEVSVRVGSKVRL